MPQLITHPCETVPHSDAVAGKHPERTECPFCGKQFSQVWKTRAKWSAKYQCFVVRCIIFCDGCRLGSSGLFPSMDKGEVVGYCIKATRTTIRGKASIKSLLTEHPELRGVLEAY